jgi:hypothetical protein
MDTHRSLKAAQNQARSLHEFTRRKAAVDALLARLQAASDEHFGADPDDVLWCHAASLGHVESLLRQAADFIAPEPG